MALVGRVLQRSAVPPRLDRQLGWMDGEDVRPAGSKVLQAPHVVVSLFWCEHIRRPVWMMGGWKYLEEKRGLPLLLGFHVGRSGGVAALDFDRFGHAAVLLAATIAEFHLTSCRFGLCNRHLVPPWFVSTRQTMAFQAGLVNRQAKLF